MIKHFTNIQLFVDNWLQIDDWSTVFAFQIVQKAHIVTSNKIVYTIFRVFISSVLLYNNIKLW